MRVAVMQPYTFPYLGYFQLMARVDVWVWLTDVQFSKNSWMNRNRILDRNGVHWWTLPVKAAPSTTLLSERNIEINSATSNKLRRKLAFAYASSPGWVDIKDVVAQTTVEGTHSLADVNIRSLLSLSEMLGIRPTFMAGNAYRYFEGTSSERLISLLTDLGATQYINAPGGRSLYSPNDFSRAGIRLLFVEPSLEPYHQIGTQFFPGLSVLDVVSRCGLDRTAKMALSPAVRLMA